jgi:hypothetical protein
VSERNGRTSVTVPAAPAPAGANEGAPVSDTNIVVLAKEPVPGRVKTRLCPRFTPGDAAQLAAAALRDTLGIVARTPAQRRVLVLDGRPGDWVPPGVEVLPQSAGGLDERIADAFGRMSGPTILIGMDTPQVTSRQLRVRWDFHDAWYGGARDGGFWALGMREPDPDLVRGVPMSTATTGAAQLERLVSAGLRVGHLPILRDIDTAECAGYVAAEAPHTEFARLYARLVGADRDVG